VTVGSPKIPAVTALQVQNTYLPVVLGVEYALLVVLAILASVLLVLERPRSGGFFLLLFWIWLVPVMFTGPGARLMHSFVGRCRRFQRHMTWPVYILSALLSNKRVARAALTCLMKALRGAEPVCMHRPDCLQRRVVGFE